MNNNIKNILLADDDPDDCELFYQALDEAQVNTKIETVNNGVKLMKYLEEADGNYPDIIFLDINMPLKSGKECLKEIRANNKLAKIPVVIFSTSSSPADIDETFESGANLYVCKPFFFDDHLKMIKQIFSHEWSGEMQKPTKNEFVLAGHTV